MTSTLRRSCEFESHWLLLSFKGTVWKPDRGEQTLVPHAKSPRRSRVNKRVCSDTKAETSADPWLRRRGLRQTMSSVLPHSPSITAPESTCLTVPLSLSWLPLASTSVTLSSQSHCPDAGSASRQPPPTPEGETPSISHSLSGRPGSANTTAAISQLASCHWRITDSPIASIC